MDAGIFEKTNENNAKESQVIVSIGTLLESGNDKELIVRNAVSDSLFKLAQRFPNEVVKTLCSYRKRNQKISTVHVGLIMNTLKNVCNKHTMHIDGDSVLQAIELSVLEMTKTSGTNQDINEDSSLVLVALGQCHSIQVMDCLLNQLKPISLPHYMIPRTMGALASHNPYATVPFIKPTITVTLPLLGGVKQDNLRQAYTYAFARFCEAISEYLTNINKAPDPTVTKDIFNTDLIIVFDVFLNQWLYSRDPKVAQEVLSALGPIFVLLPKEKILEYVSKFVNLLLGLYKKNLEKVVITQCLYTVLQTTLDIDKNILNHQIETIFDIMFEQVSTSPDFDLPAKNHFEILRCFDLLIVSASEKMFDLIMQNMKNNNEKDRIRSCMVLAHLTTSSDVYVKQRITDLTNILKVMIQVEQNSKMKNVLLKTIVAFAHRRLLIDQVFIEFIVKHCCPQKDIKINENNDAEELQRACNSSLFLLTTNVSELEQILWPTLLQCILDSKYTPAMSTLTRCLANLSTKLANNTSFDINKPPMSVPTEVSILSRCLAMLGNPLEEKKGVFILQFLKNYCVFISKQLIPLWEDKITAMLWFLEKNGKELNALTWDEFVLDFLSSTIQDLGDVKFTEGLCNKMAEQLSMYNISVQAWEKQMLYKCLATSLCFVTDVQCVKQKVDAILYEPRRYTVDESKYCAEAIGICSRVHLDVVLKKIQFIQTNELARKSSKFFNFIKDAKHEMETETLRYTLLYCYGKISVEAPSDKLSPKIESLVLDWVVQQLNTAKEHKINVAALEVIGNIARAMHPDRNVLNISLANRSNIIDSVLLKLQNHTNKEHLELFSVIVRVVTDLIMLPPAITSVERITILSLCFEKIYNATCDLKTKFNSYEEEQENDHFANYLNKALNRLNTLVNEILVQDISPSTFDDIFALLEVYMKHKNVEIRFGAMNTLEGMLRVYFEKMKIMFDAPSKFGQGGFIIGRIAPRVTDPNPNIRQLAIRCIGLVLNISSRYEGQSESSSQETTQILTKLRSDIESSDPIRIQHTTIEIGNVISQKLPQYQLLNFVESIIEALLDPESPSALGASAILSCFLKNKGNELFHNVGTIVGLCIQVAEMCNCTKAKLGGVNSLIALAVHHPKAVFLNILKQPLPFDNTVAECFLQWAQEPTLAAETLEQYIQMLSLSALHEETSNQSYDSTRPLIASLQPLSAINALSHMFLCQQMQDLCKIRFPELFSLHVMILAAYCGLAPPMHSQAANNDKYGYVPNRNAAKISPPKMAMECFRNMLICIELEQIAETLLVYTGESLLSFLQTMPGLAKALVQYAPQQISRIVESMVKYTQSSNSTQRLAAVALFAELLPLIPNNVLVDSLITTLHGGVSDPSPMVRQCVIIGLSRVGSCRPHRQGQVSAALVAVVHGLDDEEKGTSVTNIPLEAMKGISCLLKVATEQQILDIQTTVAVRIRPYLESSDRSVREAAIRLLGDLSIANAADRCDAFKEQLNASLASLLLHLSEPDDNIVKTCKYTLRQIAPLLGAVKVNTMLQDHLIDKGSLQYEAFIMNLTKTLVDELPNSVSNLSDSALPFLKSACPEIRGNAALLIGYLHGFSIFPLPLDSPCFRLAQLLSDENGSVRAKAAIGLGSLFGS